MTSPQLTPKPKGWPWIVGIVAAFVFGIGIGAASGSSAPEDEAVARPPTSNTTQEVEPTEDPPAKPEPDVEYSLSCDYVLGDFTEGTQTGFRFIADVNMDNIGNVGTVNRVTAVWYLAGGGKVTDTKNGVRIDVDKPKRIGFTVPATMDEIDRHQSLDLSSETCTVKVVIVDIFGEPQAR